MSFWLCLFIINEVPADSLNAQLLTLNIPSYVVLDTTEIGVPLRIPQLLITAPANAYVFQQGFETYEDFFRAYPFIKVQNDTIYFRGKTNVLLLKDGLPIHSLKEVCFPMVERIEIIGENTPLWGNYDGVINIITKKCHSNQPYSNFKIVKNPNAVQFEFGKAIAKTNLDVHLGGDLGEDTSHVNCNVGYSIKNMDLRGFYEHYNKQFSFTGTLFSGLNFSVKKDFYSITQRVKLRGGPLGNHRFLAGVETGEELFIQDCWELKPLLYIVPSVRYGTSRLGGDSDELYGKLSLAYVLSLNATIFGGISEDEISTGLRYYESAINLFRKEHDNGAEITVASPWLYNFKLGGAVSAKWNPGVKFTDEKTVFVEYKQSLKDRELKWNVTGDIKNEFIRAEIQIIDVKIFYRMSSHQPMYGLLWEFWN